MTWVKTCGLRTVADVVVAADAGADAIGLVLADSPRRISPVDATKLIAVAESLLTVLVTVDITREAAIDLLALTKASGIQPYGDHAAAVMEAAIERQLFVLQPVSIGGPAVDPYTQIPGVTPLFDTAIEGAHGGGGRRFDWNAVKAVNTPFVLAGGLDPTNVADAIGVTGAWGVDASSGLESAPGFKDHEKMRLFIQGAKHQ